MIEYEIFKNKITNKFDEYKINQNETIINNFYIFTKYLLDENQKYNLTSITEIDEIITKHYIDSIMILKYLEIPENAKIIDIGTGAGFPALPLHIMRNDLKITLLESKTKKISFAKNAAEKINGSPKNLIFCQKRAEEYKKEKNMQKTHEYAISRAVANLSKLCELAEPFIKPKGFFIAYKSKNADNEIMEADNIMRKLKLKINEIIKFELENENRTLIIIKKTP